MTIGTTFRLDFEIDIRHIAEHFDHILVLTVGQIS